MPIKSFSRYLVFGALFLVPLLPLIVVESFFFPFITGKAFYFRILVEIGFVAWIVLAFYDARYRPKINALTIGVTVFAVVALIADLLGVNPLRSIWSNFERMEGWLAIAHLWMFFIAATSAFGSGDEGTRTWHRWLGTSLAVAAIVGIYGLLQIFGVAAIHQGSTRIDASLGNAAYMAVYMLFHVFLAVYMSLRIRAQGRGMTYMGWIYSILAIFFAYLIFETATRGTILGLI